VDSWLIFYVAHSLRIDLDMLVVTASPARTGADLIKALHQVHLIGQSLPDYEHLETQELLIRSSPIRTIRLSSRE
jgi:hypothetical protein